jgi:hypothetical protein
MTRREATAIRTVCAVMHAAAAELPSTSPLQETMIDVAGRWLRLATPFESIPTATAEDIAVLRSKHHKLDEGEWGDA